MLRRWLIVLFTILLAAQGNAAEGVYGDYSVSVSEDLLTGTSEATAITFSTIAAGQFGRLRTLVLRCQGESPEVYVGWRDYINNRTGTLKYRVDNGPTKVVEYTNSTTGTGTFVSYKLLPAMLPGMKVVFEVNDHQGTTHQALFSLNGITAALREVEPYCVRANSQ